MRQEQRANQLESNELSLRDCIEWDTTNWGRALEYWEENTSVVLEQAKALEVGARHGGLSLWLANKGVDVLCSDLDGPSDKAKESHKKYQTACPIEYDSINALDIPFETHFDIVLFKSVLGGVGSHDNKGNQARAIQQMHKALKNGGELWFAENLVASPIHRFIRNAFVPWGKSWRYVSIPEILGFMSVFSEVDYVTVGFLGAFGRNEFQRKILGKIDVAVIDKLAPEAWKYIIIGIAKK
ncbi:MAG: class I SAM-dependent methyltransferase [Thermoguttaceae bacterium]